LLGTWKYPLVLLAASLCFGAISATGTGGDDLVWSTFLGGISTDNGADIAVDGAGCVWVTGFTESEDFPVTAGSFDETHNGEQDIFLLCLDPMGTALKYATFIGGEAADYAWDLALQRDGRVFFTGFSR
jgi:hypothetical protein